MLIFRLKISVSQLHTVDATRALTDFLSSVQNKYGISAFDSITCDSPTQAEAILTVHFADREHIRIDFNIFAAQFEAEHPEEQDVYFKMESA